MMRQTEKALAPRAEGFSSAVEMLRSQASQQGSALAYSVLDDDGEPIAHLTYAELDFGARAIAGYLEHHDARGERVLLLYPPGLDFLVGFFGCLYAGALPVPAYPPRRRKVDERIREVASDSGASVALTTRDVLDRLGGAAEADKVAANHGLLWVASDEIPPELARGWRELERREDDVAYLQYTSGSTSAPKGVMVSHGNLWHNLAAIAKLHHDGFDCPEDSVAVTWLPHFHDMGLVFGLLTPLYIGFPCHIMPPASFLQHPERWLRAMTRYRGTHSAAPNFAYDLCVRRIGPEGRAELDLERWRVAVNGAEPLRPATLRRFCDAFGPHGFRESAFCPAYGLAEATLKVTSAPGPRAVLSVELDTEKLMFGEARPVEADTEGGTELVSCGRPNLGVELAVVDPATGRRCGEGQVGEIWTRGGSVALGYWNRPNETEEVFQRHLPDEDGGPFLRTGDLGFTLDGELFVAGRVKDVIIIRGRNHYPQDIELTMEGSHPALRPAGGAAFSVEVDGKERLAAVQEVERRHRHGDIGEMLQAIRRAIVDEHEIAPYAVLVLPPGGLPKTSSGKTQRQVCRERFLAGEFQPLGEWRETPGRDLDGTTQARAGAAVRSRRDIETFLLERLRAHATLDRELEVTEPFANYGLDSADALALVAELEAYVGRRISPILFWNYPTIESLATYLASAGDEVRTECLD